jgi:REP element-mobilizing transposase RayT
MNSKTSNSPLNRRSIRLAKYDYSTAGGYYITVVTFQRECLFGEIINGRMKLSPSGEIVRREWFRTAELRSYVELREEEFVVMPNHAHGIIWIIDEARDGGGRVEMVRARRFRAPAASETVSEQFGRPVKGSIPTIVRAFKSAVTYYAGRELNTANLWQRNYYEHIIRDTPDYERIATYIAHNPENWGEMRKTWVCCRHNPVRNIE